MSPLTLASPVTWQELAIEAHRVPLHIETPTRRQAAGGGVLTMPKPQGRFVRDRPASAAADLAEEQLLREEEWYLGEQRRLLEERLNQERGGATGPIKEVVDAHEFDLARERQWVIAVDLRFALVKPHSKVAEWFEANTRVTNGSVALVEGR
jgi:hypothetical protein